MPGPGNYNLPSTLDKTSSAKFGSEQRKNATLKARYQNPGPGSYNTLIYADKPNLPHYVYL
jgi:hypothetical protein